MHHVKSRLSPYSRLLLAQRVAAGRPAAHVAAEMGVSRQTVHRWVRRFAAEGPGGLTDRSSRPHRSPGRTPAAVEAAVLAARRARHGAVWIAGELGLPASTVGRVLRRHRVLLLRDLDRLTGAPIRVRASELRYERDRPGELLHVDVKKLGKIPDGGGWRVHGRSEAVRGRGIGYDYVHSAVDDHSRAAYSEVLPDEKGVTCAGFLLRATAWFTGHGVRVERVMTDNAMAYRHSGAWRDAMAVLGARPVFIRPHCPWTNGKVERFNRTLSTEWAYQRPYTSSTDRTQALRPWLDHYNTQRRHTALGGHTPQDRLPSTTS